MVFESDGVHVGDADNTEEVIVTHNTSYLLSIRRGCFVQSEDGGGGFQPVTMPSSPTLTTSARAFTHSSSLATTQCQTFGSSCAQCNDSVLPFLFVSTQS